jgi:hypothetical protein
MHVEMPTPRAGAELVAHHLRLFGLREVAVVAGSEAHDAEQALAASDSHALIVLNPSADLCAQLDVTMRDLAHEGHVPLRSVAEPHLILRTLHPTRTLSAPGGRPAVTAIGDPVWLWTRDRGRPVLLVASDLGADILRYRQGDPTRTSEAPANEWGYSGERPTRLFEHQLDSSAPFARFVDDWVATLANTVAAELELTLPPLLPGGAPGAIVVTGDDDAAYLDAYDLQRRLLRGLPTTYFLHPSTRHDRTTLRELGANVELGLHPDALEHADRYGEILADQVGWFTALTGERPRLVRNHGYLSDGYWGHLPAWLDQGIVASSNLPGVDGTVLNGSLLPALLASGDGLTAHWSILTAAGDGMVDALGASDAEAAARLLELGASVTSSGVPGVIVLNLHPQNAERTPTLHAAVHRLVEDGFLPWTLGECISWFAARDEASGTP